MTPLPFPCNQQPVILTVDYLPSSLNPLFCAPIFPSKLRITQFSYFAMTFPSYEVRSSQCSWSSACHGCWAPWDGHLLGTGGKKPAAVRETVSPEMARVGFAKVAFCWVETAVDCSFCWLNASRSVMPHLSGIVLTEVVFMENTLVFWEQLLELRWNSNEDSYSTRS